MLHGKPPVSFNERLFDSLMQGSMEHGRWWNMHVAALCASHWDKRGNRFDGTSRRKTHRGWMTLMAGNRHERRLGAPLVVDAAPPAGHEILTFFRGWNYGDRIAVTVHLIRKWRPERRGASLLPALRPMWMRHGLSRSFGKLKIGLVDRAAVVLVIEPDEHAAGVYRADDAVPASSPRRPVDYAPPEVGLLRNDHWTVPFFGNLYRHWSTTWTRYK
jgi:hypothetical protein